MSVAQLQKASGGTVKAMTFPEMLDRYKSQIAMALPRHLNPDRMARVALTEFRKNTALGNCTPESIMSSLITLSQLGLEPGVMGQAYLIPYKNTCTAVPGWQGYVDLVSRAGRATVHTDAVRSGDAFEYAKGTSPFIQHVPSDSSDEAPFTHVYAVGRVRGAEHPIFEVWSRKKAEAHLKRYNKVGERHYAKQSEHNFEMYARKCALLQVIKYLPKSVELQTAANLDYSADAGTQTISLREAVEGTFVPNGYDDASAPDTTGVIEAEPMSPDRKLVEELYELLGTPANSRELLLKEYAGKLPELAKLLQSKLPEDN